MADGGILKACRYRVNTMRLNIDGQTVDVNAQMVSEIIIDKPYDQAYFPYFEITFSIPNDTYRALRENNVEIRCYVDIQKGMDTLSINDEQKTDTSLISWSSWIEGNFYCFSSDGTPATDKAQQEEYEQDEDIRNTMDLSNMTTTRIALYNEQYLFAIKQTVNGVFQNIDVTSAMAWICSSVGLENIICSPATNMDPIEQLIIPPYTAANALSWVANNYRMHDCGTLLFFDMKRAYILNKNATTSAWADGDIKITHIQSVQGATDTYGACCGCAVSGTDITINMQENSMKFSTPSVVKTQKTGSSMRIVDAETGSMTDINTGATTTSMGENMRVYTNQTGDVNPTALETALKEASRQIDANFSAVDVSAFDPNKECVFVFTDPQFADYGGSYRCSAMKCVMQKDGDTFIPYVQATFVGGYN